jgi:hypothetical protein
VPCTSVVSAGAFLACKPSNQHTPQSRHASAQNLCCAACLQVKYRGSAEERADLLQLVNRFKGDMRSVFDWLMLSRPELDSHRFRDTLEEAVAAGEQHLGVVWVELWSSCIAATGSGTRWKRHWQQVSSTCQWGVLGHNLQTLLCYACHCAQHGLGRLPLQSYNMPACLPA